jgi:ribosomal protein S27AE
MTEKSVNEGGMYPWQAPLWTDGFFCKRCGATGLMLDHYDRSKTGVITSTIACRECREEYRVVWHVSEPRKYILVGRWRWIEVKNGRGRMYRVAENSPDDMKRLASDTGAV